ncbi:hypothetical protein [Ponticaulis sp.]|uniref:hypothetical protein n=1 Tax=Ponticaulis sp. TaxID=2020902 RepID=UPI000B70707E|nr:hypothetical protein [Ponticaulis sp.]MAI91494.1 hypothetical protein [Ponticaulis sp.]OUX97458.1 MAG: hypothetical protein CBB65_13720 [Hyphomonadaceae bacterium TMED5]
MQKDKPTKLVAGIATLLVINISLFLFAPLFEVSKIGQPDYLNGLDPDLTYLWVALWMGPFLLIGAVNACALWMVLKSRASGRFILNKLMLIRLLATGYILSACWMSLDRLLLGGIAEQLSAEIDTSTLLVTALLGAGTLIQFLALGLEHGARADEENESFV